MAQTTKSQVTLKGSAQMVSEFFNYGINSILYQRGIYPPGSSENLFFVCIKYIFSTIYNIFLRIIYQKTRIWFNNFGQHRRKSESFFGQRFIPNKGIST